MNKNWFIVISALFLVASPFAYDRLGHIVSLLVAAMLCIAYWICRYIDKTVGPRI